MNTKTIKYYDKIFEFGRVDPLSEPDKVYDFFSYMLDYSFDLAGEIWEYLLESKKFALQSSQVIISLVDKVLILFADKSEQKTAKLLSENLVVRTAVYQLSANADSKFTLAVICNILLSSKIETSEDFLKVLQKNTVIKNGFAGAMKEIINSQDAKEVSNIINVLCVQNKRCTQSGFDSENKRSNLKIQLII